MASQNSVAFVAGDDLKQQLLLAQSRCRVGDNKTALRLCQRLHKKYPTSVECLKILVHVCSEMKMKDHVHDYVFKLRQLGVGSPSKFIGVQPTLVPEKAKQTKKSPVKRTSVSQMSTRDVGGDANVPEVHARALKFFERAAQLEPNEPKWKLMIGQCYRRAGDVDKALELFRNILKDHPSNVPCLEGLVSMCSEMELFSEGNEYSEKLQYIQKEKEREERVKQEIAERERLVQMHISSRRKEKEMGKDGEEEEEERDEEDEEDEEAAEVEPEAPPPVDAEEKIEEEEEGSGEPRDVQVYRQSMAYFQDASALEPDQIKWRLVMAACHRRVGNDDEALLEYENIHREFPENIEAMEEMVSTLVDLKQKDRGYHFFNRLKRMHSENPANVDCLRALANVSIELGLREEFNHYVTLLRKTVEEQAAKKRDTRLDLVFEEHRNRIPQSRRDRLKDLFDLLDRDGTATIEFGELVRLARRFQPGLSRAKVKKAMRTLDTGNNGCIDYTDFLNWMGTICETFTDVEFDRAMNTILEKMKEL